MATAAPPKRETRIQFTPGKIEVTQHRAAQVGEKQVTINSSTDIKVERVTAETQTEADPKPAAEKVTKKVTKKKATKKANAKTRATDGDDVDQSDASLGTVAGEPESGQAVAESDGA